VFNLFSKKPVTRTNQNRAQLGVMSLESRDLMSVSPMAAVAKVAMTNMTPLRIVVNPVPNLAGFKFHLISSNGAPAHDLTIQTEMFLANGSATFTGTWRGASGDATQVMNGSIKRDLLGNIKISFNWAGNHYFNGTVTPVASTPKIVSIFGPQYHLDGNVTIAGNPNGGPGHVSGNGSKPMVYAVRL